MSSTIQVVFCSFCDNIILPWLKLKNCCLDFTSRTFKIILFLIQILLFFDTIKIYSNLSVSFLIIISPLLAIQLWYYLWEVKNNYHLYHGIYKQHQNNIAAKFIRFLALLPFQAHHLFPGWFLSWFLLSRTIVCLVTTKVYQPAAVVSKRQSNYSLALTSWWANFLYHQYKNLSFIRLHFDKRA